MPLAGLHQPSRAVLDSFRQVVGFDYFRVFQVSNGAGKLKDAVESPGGKIKLLHRRLKQALGGFFRLAKIPYLAWHHLGVASQSRSLEAFLLPGAGGVNPALNQV